VYNVQARFIYIKGRHLRCRRLAGAREKLNEIKIDNKTNDIIISFFVSV
jgi:hypothetical protein